MTTEIKKTSNGKVLAFKKEDEFFFKRGLAMLEKNKQLDAIMNFRRALEMDLDNPEYAISLAEALAGIGKFEESNRVIFAFFPDVNERPPEGFFGLGCNFASLSDYENSKACMEQYLLMDADGEYANEAMDVLEAIEAFENEERKNKNKKKAELYAVKDPLPSITDILSAEENDAKYGPAAVEKLISKDKKLFFLRNLLAIKYFLNKEYEKAEEQTAFVLKENPSNIHAHCNNLMIAHAKRDETVYAQEIKYLLDYKTENMNELNRMAVTLLEYSKSEDALPVLKHMYTKAPYDKRIIHKLAICYYVMSDYKKCIALYDKIIKFDEGDDVAYFYRNMCASVQNGETKRGALVLDYEVPMDEFVRRVSKIKEIIAQSFEKQLEAWQTDAAAQRLIIWGIHCHDLSVKRAMLALIGTFADRKAELIIRDFLLIPHENDDVKREAFAHLAQMQAKEPYIAYIGGALVESRVDRIEFMEKIPKIYRDILTNCIANMENKYETEALIYATHIWKNFIKASDGELASINKNQAEAMSVVLEYLAARLNGSEVSKYELCMKYSISSARFEHALAKLEMYAVLENFRGRE